MNRSTVNGIIWCKTFSRGVKQFDKIVQSYKNHGYEVVKDYYSKDQRLVYFSNGDKWQIKSATDKSRGYKCNISYIDEEIGRKTIREIIGPCTMGYPFQAFNYY